MDTNSSGRKREIEERIALIDRQIKSPEERTKDVLEFLRDNAGDVFNAWDLLCFSICYLTTMCVPFDWLSNEVRSLNQKLYNAHYFKTDELGLIQEEFLRQVQKNGLHSIENDPREVEGTLGNPEE